METTLRKGSNVRIVNSWKNKPNPPTEDYWIPSQSVSSFGFATRIDHITCNPTIFIKSKFGTLFTIIWGCLFLIGGYVFYSMVINSQKTSSTLTAINSSKHESIDEQTNILLQPQLTRANIITNREISNVGNININTDDHHATDNTDNTDNTDIAVVKNDSQSLTVIYPKFDLKFIHIPKTGGTTIENLFLTKFDMLQSFLFFSRHPKRHKQKKKWKSRFYTTNDTMIETCCVPWHATLDFYFTKLEKNNITNNIALEYYSKSFEYFAIVRNPYQRYLSQYKYCTTDENFKCTRRYMRGIFDAYDYCNIDTFNQFTNFTLNRFLNDKKYFDCVSHCHFARQYDYVYHNGIKYLKDENILKLENFDEDLIQLLNRYQDTLNKVNSKDIKQAKQHFNHNCTNLQIDDLTRENIRLFNKVYEMDFKSFGYQMIDTNIP